MEARPDSLSIVLARIEARKQYPPLARLRGISGKVRVSFRVGLRGEALDVRVVATSGSEILDRAAVQAIRAASPYPIPPDAFLVGITFHLDGRDSADAAP